MKIKKYIASDIATLMRLVREELGEDAVIISTSDAEDGKIEMIAALDSPDINWDNLQQKASDYNDVFLRERLSKHLLTASAASSILSACRQIATENKINDDSRILTAAFEQLYKFGNFFDMSRPIKMFVGTHGSGKTTTLVKMALLAKLRNIPVKIISIDNVRTGANNQLESLSKILEIDFDFVRDKQVLFDKILKAQGNNQMILIDTFAINPYLSEDIERLRQWCKIISSDKVLTLDAMSNAENAVEIAEIFMQLGIDWLFPTKMDATRRIGTILSVAALHDIKLGYGGVGPHISEGAALITAKALARLITE